MKSSENAKERISMNVELSNQQVMTVKEMAAHLHVPKSTARKIIRRGHVRYQRLGKRWIVPVQDIQKFLDSHWKQEGVA